MHLFILSVSVGTPDEGTWPGVSSLPNYMAFQPKQSVFPVYEGAGSMEAFIQEHYHQTPVAALFQAFAPADSLYVFVTLITGCLALNPLRRITAEKALGHAYFMMQPPRTVCSKLRLPYSALVAESVAEPGAAVGVGGDGEEGYRAKKVRV